LPRVANKDQTLDAPERIQRRRQHLLSEHRRLVDHHQIGVDAGVLVGVQPGGIAQDPSTVEVDQE